MTKSQEDGNTAQLIQQVEAELRSAEDARAALQRTFNSHSPSGVAKETALAREAELTTKINELAAQLTHFRRAGISGRVIISGVDVTVHVAAMYDAIVGSLDWGSGFLCTEDIESIMIVADLMGLDPPQVDSSSAPKDLLVGMGITGSINENHSRICAAWAAQVKAKVAAMRADEGEPLSSPE